ncbi:hybrid sensor histidine kinase response regulator [Micractinium conductrix]|uniref:histidine kinase n=1 Tax=Micractinium conductrix TaxID=554055 RepID=A0A2P6V9M3_9CHLO|nr:hybrid sensor histidine kinase response regulator [Micractinium conductrix]|eukprot:PSC70789.1 hybrid sensor histidine kinase response regulator [Micractinium conductrix]
MAGEAGSRWRVLTLVAMFDIVMFVVRAAAKAAAGSAVASALALQLGNMAALYSLTALLNARSRRLGSRAAHQEEAMLCCLIAGAISVLLLSLRPETAADYVYAALFLTCTSSVLKLRWFVGTLALAVPVGVIAATNLRLRIVAAAACGVTCACAGGSLDALALEGAGLDGAAACPAGGTASWLQFEAIGPLPLEALVHILVAWAVGALMAYVSDSNRRASFVSHKLALHAAAKELKEVQARVLMERELAAAQQQAAARALVVAKEQAANEAKSEFMSLMCHEVRTPLNGCLASAEMLLDTELDEDQRELAKTIRVSGSILLSTVSNFLDFFKIEAGKQLDIVRSPLDLRDLVTDVHCIIEAMVGRERGIALLPPDCDGAPPTVLGDPSRICGILLNLYTNAAKYTKKGSIALRVRVVGPNYRPDPVVALGFCETRGGCTTGGTTGATASRNDSRASHSTPESAFVTSGRSTPTGVLAGAAGRPSGGKPGAAEAHAVAAGGGGAHPLYHHGGRAERGSAGSLQTAGAVSGSAADGAANLLNRQAAAAGVPHAIMSSVTEVDGWCSVHSQADPRFVMRHAPSSQACGAAGGSVAGSEGSDGDGESQRFLSFEVLDTGVGVSRRALESLFQDYVQGTDAEMQRPRAKGGTGLGLSICCKQVAVLGGAIGALSKPACGSIFWFTTPLLLPPHGSSSSDSLEASSEGEAAAADAVAEAEEAAAAAAAEAAPTPRQAAGAAAMRRSREFHCAAATEAAAVAAAHGDEGLPRGIPAGHSGRKASGESSQLRGGSGSRRQSMESDLSSMWPSHKAPRPHGSATRLDQMEEDASYHPRHALSWETAPQPPSFTAAEMLQAMPLALGGGGGGSSGGVPAAAVPRRGAPTGRTSLGGAVAHLGAVRHHQAATAPAPCGAAAGAGVAAADAARRRQSSSSLLGLRVLLAEDNLINQTVAKRVLTSLGCQCCVASNGREAVMAVEEAEAGGAPFDVILMDMCMPVLGGVEATQEIRQLGCRVPIVAMTANASERDRVECIAAGMDGFLSKPVLKEQLSVAIREATQGGHRA